MQKYSVLLLLTTAVFFFGCDNAVQGRPENNLKQFREDPVTITWKGDTKDEIQGFQANVQIYKMNSRTDTGAHLTETYRVVQKTIDGKIYTRIDFPETSTTAGRSVMQNDKEIILFNPQNNVIEQRFTVQQNEHPFLKLFAGESIMGRINLKAIKEEAMRLALDIAENDKGLMVIGLPAGIFPQELGGEVTSRRIAFDPATETVQGVEIVTMLEDGSVRTTNTKLLYAETEGVPIKVGSITTIDTKVPWLIEDLPDGYPVYNSPDDIPTISEEQFQQMESEGNIFETPDVVFGDPADLSQTETIIELYSDVEINNVPDRLFKLLLK